MYSHFHLLSFAASEGPGGVVLEEVFKPETGLGKLVMGGLEGGGKGSVPLMS